MSIESILANRKYHERNDNLNYCNFTEQCGNNPVHCSRHSFNMQCFREDNFTFCHKHHRIITAGKLVCNHKDKGECLAMVWEGRDNWEGIIEGDLASHSLRNKGLEVEELMQALLPPQLCAHLYK
ncbi:hypothetical protein EJ02DRAFT_510924 [Clathrospora elynae]|uniref:Uncharacterized protein n=1 Tax=Clathrospora elynae TaxID=706981 RepID=A0A6A5T2Q2_9PLEO|nr:hypothetical protein EJ02DRAFT_510924 [Clathrospora elynae]